ncbi:MAG: DUF2339 domain-containing protein [Planctomycetia bacterium]|nr:DUF2339 domain-containing protein [Planctomycetia bacterium]
MYEVLVLSIIVAWFILVWLPCAIMLRIFFDSKMRNFQKRVDSVEERLAAIQREQYAQAHSVATTVPKEPVTPVTPAVPPLPDVQQERVQRAPHVWRAEPTNTSINDKTPQEPNVTPKPASSDLNPFEYGIERIAANDKIEIDALAANTSRANDFLDFPTLVDKPTIRRVVNISKITQADNSNAFDRVELQIGRKIFAWGAVALFVVALALFAQTALARGWFTPITRFVSILLFGVAALFAGRYTFKHGLRAYSRTLDSTGVIAFFLSGYYALCAELFDPTLSAAILCASVFLGYFLSTLRRSSLVAFVSSLGGLLAPVLIQSDFSLQWIAPYLLVYLLASIGVVNYLRRSYLAVVPLYGVLALLWSFSNSLTSAEFGLYTVTLLTVAILELIDQALVLLYRRRQASYSDVIRALSVPFITLGVFVLLCKHADYTVHIGALTDYPLALYHRYGFIPVTLFAAAYGIILTRWLKQEKTPLNAMKIAEESKSKWQVVDLAKRLQLRSYLASACFASVLARLAVIVVLVFSHRFTSVGFFALTVALLIITQRVASQPVLPSLFEGIDDVKLRGAMVNSFQKAQRTTLNILFIWSIVDAILGVAKLASYFSLNYDLYPVRLFLNLDGATHAPWPFLNAPCIPLLACALILLCAGFACKYKSTSKIAVANLAQIWAILAVCFGATLLLVISVSETFAALAVRIYQANYAAPSAVAVCCVASLWALVALALYLFALPRRRSAWRLGSYCLMLVLLIKLGVFHLLKRPELGIGPLPPLFLRPELRHPDIPEALQNLTPYDWTTPLWNLFSFPFLVAFLVALLVAVLERTFYRRQLQTTDSKSAVQRPIFAVFLGVVASLLFFIDSSCDLWRMVAHKYPWHDMNATRALWLYWTFGAVVVWAIGRLAQSLTTRVFAYFILMVALPSVCYGEFLSGNARTNDLTVSSFLSVYALPAACYFIALIILGIRSNKLPTIESTNGVRSRSLESQALNFLGLTLGIFGLLTLLSFEITRYFTGKNLLDSAIDPGLFCMTILWSLAILLISFLYHKVNSAPLKFVLSTLFVACLVKYFGWDLPSLRRHYALPFLNLFAYNTYIIFISLLYLGYKLTRGATEPQRKRGRTLFGVLVTIALIQLWLGTTSDLYCRLGQIPNDVGADSFFLAQTAVSVLWALFAGALLAIGFIKHTRLLRWHAIILFSLTTLKILTHDLSYLDSAYRFIGFFILAGALTVAAYAYNRLSHK